MNEADVEKSTTGLDANVAGALAYLLFFISGVLFLAVERDSRFVRFHALQSTMVFLTLFVLDFALGYLMFLGFLSRVLLVPTAFILWLVLMFRAYQGEKFKLPIAGDVAEQRA